MIFCEYTPHVEARRHHPQGHPDEVLCLSVDETREYSYGCHPYIRSNDDIGPAAMAAEDGMGKSSASDLLLPSLLFTWCDSRIFFPCVDRAGDDVPLAQLKCS